MGNNGSGLGKNGEEHFTPPGSREELTPEGSEFATETSYTSTFNQDNFTITSPIQFEGPDGVKFDVKDVVVDEYELISNFEGFLDRMNIGDNQKNMMMSLPRERKLALLSMETETKATDPAKCLKYILLVQEADRKKVRKKANDSRFLQILQDLAISLRTNNIYHIPMEIVELCLGFHLCLFDWVKKFLDEHNGLEYLIDYIRFRIDFELQMGTKSDTKKHTSTLSQHPPATSSLRTMRDRSIRASPHVNDLHICMLCLKAIMNSTCGLHSILGHRDCLTQMTRVMLVSQLRTSTLILDLLSAVCHFKNLNGHNKVIEAVDAFAVCKGEAHRFQTLVYHFYDSSCPMEFRLSCLGFIYILCSLSPNLNYRVRLYHEFSELGLDEFLNALEEEETHAKFLDLSIAYRDDNLDVKELLDSCHNADEMSRELELLKETSEEADKKYTACEFESIKKIAKLEREAQLLTEKLSSADRMLVEKTREEELLSVKLDQQAANYEEKLRRQSVEIPRAVEMVALTTHPVDIPVPPPSLPEAKADTNIPAPPPDMPGVGSCIPDPPPDIGDNSKRTQGTNKSTPSVPAPGEKRRIQTNYRLPVLNWCTVTRAQVHGTIFSEIDDENILKTLDFKEFEETFKTKAQPKQEEARKETPASKTGKALQRIGTPKAVQPPVFLETNRVRNIGISMKRFGKNVQEIKNAIIRMDTNVLNSEYVELLTKLIPTELEEKAMAKYNKEEAVACSTKQLNPKPKPKLLQEEKFLLELYSIDRLSAKLEVMQFLCGCESELERLQNQLDCVSTASHAVLSSQSFKKIMELVLAFGNYMNSSKRGAVYGFKLESLDLLSSTWSTDKKQSLLHYIAKIVKDTNPEYASFVTEMRYLQKASLVTMDNLDADIQDLNKQCSKGVRELVYDKGNEELKDFLLTNEPRTTKLTEDYKLAKTAFLKCGKYLGEDASCLRSNTMFQLLNKFRLHYERVEKENEQRIIFEKSQEIAMKRIRPSVRKAEEKQTVDMQHDAAYDGAVDDIISNLRKVPHCPKDNMVSRRRDTPRRRNRQRSQRALTTELSLTGSEELPRTESMPGDCTSPAAVRAINIPRNVSLDMTEKEQRRLEAMPKLSEEGDRTARGDQGLEAKAKREAKRDAMGQPIHDEDSSQDELVGKGISREVDKSKPFLSNTNPSYVSGEVSPTRTTAAELESVTIEAPLFVNNIAAMFVKPATQVDASSGKKVVSDDPFLKSRPWLH